MSMSHPPPTTLSNKGRFVLPKPIRDALGWGTEAAGGAILATRTQRPQDLAGATRGRR